MADNQSSLVEPSLRFAKKLECSQSGVVALEWWAGWSGQTDKRIIRDHGNGYREGLKAPATL